MKINCVALPAIIASIAQAQDVIDVQVPVVPVQAQLAKFPELLTGRSNQQTCENFTALLDPIKSLVNDASDLAFLYNLTKA
ncbi:hypothetical protein BGX26_012886 [Mortierella sp. AD094]|nr:hypothetical protein BGX26_012886 [Mortierella sp. AD094]